MSNITVTFSNLTADEAANLFAAIKHDYVGPAPVATDQPTPAEPGLVAAPAAQESTPAPAKKPRGRPRKTADKTPPNQEMELPPAKETQAAATTDSTATLDDMRKALSDLMAAKDMKACADVLGEFGASRISEVKPEQYANVRDRALQAAKS